MARVYRQVVRSFGALLSIVHDGLPDLLDDLRARAEAALMGTFEHGDHVGDVAVVAVGAIGQRHAVVEPQQLVVADGSP